MNTKQLKLPVKIDLINHPGQTLLSILFPREALSDWCLSLSLLKEGLVGSVMLTQADGRSTLKFRVSPNIGGKMNIILGQPNEIELTSNALGYLLHFFLQYYRDGVATVDHIDLEGIDPTNHNREIDVVLKVTDYQPPLSPEELEKRMT